MPVVAGNSDTQWKSDVVRPTISRQAAFKSMGSKPARQALINIHFRSGIVIVLILVSAMIFLSVMLTQFSSLWTGKTVSQFR